MFEAVERSYHYLVDNQLSPGPSVRDPDATQP